jgi:hypothetical protein
MVPCTVAPDSPCASWPRVGRNTVFFLSPKSQKKNNGWQKKNSVGNFFRYEPRGSKVGYIDVKRHFKPPELDWSMIGQHLPEIWSKNRKILKTGFWAPNCPKCARNELKLRF